MFVHGLRTGPVSGWQNDDQSLWLVELLALDLKVVRTFSFGYDQEASYVCSDDLSKSGSGLHHGKALCADLRDRHKYPTNDFKARIL